VGTTHEHLAEVLDVVALPGGCAVVSERLDGPNLAVLRVSRAPLELGEAASLLASLGGALDHLHVHGVTHGDVSPANVVLTSDGRPVLVDLVGEVAFEAGTPGFRAPERAAGAAAGPAGDVWPLARTVTWLLDPKDVAHAEAVLAPALAADPAARCSASDLAGLARRLGEARAVLLPPAPSLAQGSLRARAVLEETRLAARRPRGARLLGGTPATSPRPARGVGSRPSARQAPRHRAEHGPLRRWIAVGAVVAAGLAFGLDLPGVLGGRPTDSLPPVAADADPSSTPTPPGASGSGEGAEDPAAGDGRGERPRLASEVGADPLRSAVTGGSTAASGGSADATADGVTATPDDAASSGGEPPSAVAEPGPGSPAERPGSPGAAGGTPAGGRTGSGAGQPGGPAVGIEQPPEAAPVAAPDNRGLAAAVGELVADRDRALNSGDADALRDLTVPGSPAAKADAPVAAALSGGARVQGLATEVRRVQVLEPAAAAPRVAVVTTQRAHTRSEGSGSAPRTVPPQPEQCSVLVVQPAERGVRLADVAACD
jgi:hypothetical protein